MTRDDAEHQERLEGRVVDDLAGAGELGEADDRGERRALDQLHQEADGRRHRDLAGLRQDHVAHAGEVAQAERGRGLPLAGGNRLDAAAPDLAEERAGVERQRDRRRRPADRCRSPSTGAAEEHQEQLHQQRRALEQLDEAGGSTCAATPSARCARAPRAGRRCRRRRRRSADSSSVQRTASMMNRKSVRPKLADHASSALRTVRTRARWIGAEQRRRTASDSAR